MHLNRWIFAIVLAVAPIVSACSNASHALVDRSRLVMSGPEKGRFQVSGLPGAVLGGEATTLTLTVSRDSAVPKAYSLAHFGAGMAIDSDFAVVNADGSFGPVSLGEDDRPVTAEDELVIQPIRGVTDVGYTLILPVVWRL